MIQVLDGEIERLQKSINHQKGKDWNVSKFSKFYKSVCNCYFYKEDKKLLWKSIFSLRIHVLDGEIHRIQKSI